MTEYYVCGYKTDELKEFVRMVERNMRHGSYHYECPNGDMVLIYGSHNDWLVVDDMTDREYEFNDDYFMAVQVLGMGREF